MSSRDPRRRAAARVDHRDDNLLVTLNTNESVRLVERLSRLHMNVSVAHGDQMRQLCGLAACQRIHQLVDVASAKLNKAAFNIVDEKDVNVGAYLVDQHVEDRVDEFASRDKTRTLRIRCGRDENMFFVLKEAQKLRLFELDNLESLDLGSVHIHSKDSICRIIAHLKCNFFDSQNSS